MSPTQHQWHIEKLMATEVKPVEAKQEDVAQPMPPDPGCHMSLSFEDSGLSRLVHAASRLKASQLVQKQNSIYPAPGTHQHEAFFVESTSGGPSKPNYVVMKPTGGVVCDCEKFQETSLCSHSIAVSKQNGKLAQHLPWFKEAEQQLNLSVVATRGAPSSIGHKPGAKRPRSRNRNPTSRNNSIAIDDSPRVERTTIWQNENPFQLMFITPNQGKCITCKKTFNKGSNTPFNLCLSHKE